MRQKYTKYQIALELIGLFMIIGMIVLLILRWGQLPEKIPGHFDLTGAIDRWGNKSEIIIIPIISIALYLFASVSSIFPNKMNVPIKITEENKDRVYRCLKTFVLLLKIEGIGILTYILYIVTSLKPLPSNFLPISLMIMAGTLIIFIAYTMQIAKKKG